MLKLTQLLNKRIFDVSTERPLGFLKTIMMDKREKRCLLSTDSDIYAVDSILLDRDDIRVTNAIQTFISSELTIKKQVYDINGKYLGQISDVEIGKTARSFKITVSNGETYSKGRIRAVDDVVILNNPSSKKRKKVKKLEIKNDEKKEIKNTSITTHYPYPTKRRYGDFSFLIGKTVDKNINNFYGEIMIRNGEKITIDTLRQAKVSGKLVELCLHSK